MKRRKKEQTGGAAAAVQVRERGGHPFAALRGYMPLGGADAALYGGTPENRDATAILLTLPMGLVALFTEIPERGKRTKRDYRA